MLGCCTRIPPISCQQTNLAGCWAPQVKRHVNKAWCGRHSRLTANCCWGAKKTHTETKHAGQSISRRHAAHSGESSFCSTMGCTWTSSKAFFRAACLWLAHTPFLPQAVIVTAVLALTNACEGVFLSGFTSTSKRRSIRLELGHLGRVGGEP